MIRHFRRSLIAVVTSICAAVCAADVPLPPKAEPVVPAIGWYSDVGQAFADAHEKKQRMILFLELPDQTWSRQLLDRFSEPGIVELAKEFVPARVDIRKESQLLDQLITRVIPDLRVFDSEGKQVAHTSGSLDAAALKKFLADAKRAQAESGAPSLSMLFPSSDLEGLAKIESAEKVPEGQNVARLLNLAGGQSGETRQEAQRLLKRWARKLAPQLPEYLGASALRARLTAYEALSDLEAPLENYDPWSGPAPTEVVAKLQTWGKPVAAKADGEVKKGGEFPVLAARVRAQVDGDLKDLRGDDPARQESARQRLASVGRGLVPILREQSRALAAADAETALRYDELRFRLLLGTETLRKRPNAPHKLAVGNPGARASLLSEILQSDSQDSNDLAREAACDRDPLFRETAIRLSAAAIEYPGDLLLEALKDTEPNVRVAALTVMAQSSSGDYAKAIAKYLAGEPDADMIGHAIRALSAVDKESSREAIRELLKDKRWQVRASAVEALGKMKDEASAAQIQALAEGDDGFVAGQAIAAMKELDSPSINLESMLRAVKKYPSVTLNLIKTIGHGKLRKTVEGDKLLREFTKSENPDIRAQAIDALASDRDRPAFEEVAAAMSDPVTKVRRAGVAAMRELIDRNTIRKLNEAKKPLPDGYLEVRDKILAMLKDPDDELRSETVQSLCYFGEWSACWVEFKKLLSSPNEHLRSDIAHAIYSLPKKQILDAARYCLQDAATKRTPDEWSSIFSRVLYTMNEKASAWEEGDEAVQAVSELLPRLEPEKLADALRQLRNQALNDREMVQNSDKANRVALAKVIENWMSGLPVGAHKHALRLFWLQVAEMPDAKLREYLNDPDLEIRRMALVGLIRSQTKGPEDLVKKYINDPAPEMRQLAVAAAIPEAWREGIDNPVSAELISGQLSHGYRNYSQPDVSKEPKVVQLTVETLEKLLKDDDELVRALTAYLMSLEGGDQGIPVLQRYAKSAKNSEAGALMFMRAVIMAWSDELTPQLEQAWRAMKNLRHSYDLQQLMPQINALKGKEVKKLRAKMAKEAPARED